MVYVIAHTVAGLFNSRKGIITMDQTNSHASTHLQTHSFSHSLPHSPTHLPSLTPPFFSHLLHPLTFLLFFLFFFPPYLQAERMKTKGNRVWKVSPEDNHGLSANSTSSSSMGGMSPSHNTHTTLTQHSSYFRSPSHASHT